MKMFIPKLNTKLRLTKNWSFSLLCEIRNRSLWNMKTEFEMYEAIPHEDRKFHMRIVNLHKGDELEITRIFVRRAADGFNSISLRGWVAHEGEVLYCTFWVVLDDFNRMEAEEITDG